MNKHRFKTPGLVLAVAIGAVALFAVVAVAANLGNGGVAGKILVGNPPVATQEALATNAQFTGQLEALTTEPTVTHMVLLIPSIKALILCTSADVEEGK